MNKTEQFFSKAYVVKFTDKRDGNNFLKFGATNDYDILDRFRHSPHQYRHYDIAPVCSIYMKVNTPNKGKGGVIEKYFLRKYPRNVGWIKENFSGISEIYKPGTDAEETKIRNEWYAIQDRVYINGELVNSMFGEEGDPLFTSIRAAMQPDLLIIKKEISRRKSKMTPEEEAEEKKRQWRSSCDCMFGCSRCNPEPFDPTNPSHH